MNWSGLPSCVSKDLQGSTVEADAKDIAKVEPVRCGH